MMAGSVQCVLNGHLSWLPVVDKHLPQNNTIYIWRGETAELLALYDRCYAVLDDTEKARAISFLQATDRQRYVIQHGLLHVLLGWYVGRPLFNKKLRYGKSGKPHLTDEGLSRCFFSLTSSCGGFLIAIGDREIGIDMERPRPEFDYQDIAVQYFGKAEQDYITASAKPEQMFLLLWTRKEALLKATEKGIDDDLALTPALNGAHLLPANYGNRNWITQSYIAAADNEVISITHPKPEIMILTRQIEAAWAGVLFS